MLQWYIKRVIKSLWKDLLTYLGLTPEKVKPVEDDNQYYPYEVDKVAPVRKEKEDAHKILSGRR